MDLIPEDIREEFCQEVLDRLNWPGRVYRVSGHSGEGCDALCKDIMDYIYDLKEAEKAALIQQKLDAHKAASIEE